MASLRSVSRALLAGLYTVICTLSVLLANLLTSDSKGRKRRWIRAIYRAWGRGMTAILKVEVALQGRPPDPPFLLVTNHLSYLDILVLAGAADCTFIAKSEIARWPVLGTACRGVETIFVDRNNRRDLIRVNNQILDTLEKKRGVVLFGEGTTSNGESILPLKASLLALAAEQELAVHYALLHYRTPEGSPPASDSVCWWGEMTLLPHLLGLTRLSRVYATVSFAESPLRDSDRKNLALRLHNAMLERYQRIVGPGEPCKL